MLIGLLAVSVLIGVWVVGIVPYDFNTSYAVIVVLVSGFSAWPRRSRSRVTENILILVISSGVALITAELLLRLFLGHQYFRTDEYYSSKYPPMPLVHRYRPNESYRGIIFGNLAAMTGIKEYREMRPLVFKTDAFGFRNENNAAMQPCDVIVLGDSFGIGAETSQEATWTSRLHSRYGLQVYNLSFPGEGPWHYYINLLMEFDRLKIGNGCTVLVALFAGNDLEDQYYNIDSLTELPWSSGLERTRNRIGAFRYRSVIRRLLEQVAMKEVRAMHSKVDVCDFPGGRKVLFFRPYIDQSNYTEDEIRQHHNSIYLKKILTQFRNFCGEKSLQLNVALFPSKEEVYRWVIDGQPSWPSDSAPSALSRIVGEFSRDNGISFTDLKPFFLQESKRVFEATGSLLWWADDTHLNEQGNDVAARMIYEKVLLPRKQ